MKRVLGLLLRQEPALVRAFHTWRRHRFVLRLRLLAILRRTSLDVEIGPDLRLGRRIGVHVAPRSAVTVRMGAHCRIGDDVQLHLSSGSLWWGDGVQLRVGSTMKVDGEIWCEGGNIFSFGCVIHCAESIRIQQWSGSAEYATIVDSAHYFTEPDVCISENTVSSPVSIGKNVFLAPRVSVGRGITIGDFSVIGPNSTVTKDVPAGSLASGVPATVVRMLDLPWDAPRPSGEAAGGSAPGAQHR